MQYHRVFVPGGTHFFTVNLADRSSRLLVEHVDTLRDAVRQVKHRHPFEIPAGVVLPDHLHAIWTLPPDDSDFSIRWMPIKAGFSRRLPMIERRNASRTSKDERGIWQRRFWEHLIRNQHDLVCHVNYIHINPVKHGLVTKANAWPWSSIHRYIRAGILPAAWAAEPDVPANFGERPG